MCKDTQRVGEPSQLGTLQTQWVLWAEREELVPAERVPASWVGGLQAPGSRLVDS